MGEQAITISDKKTVRADIFEDHDLLSDEEKAAMADDAEGEGAEDQAKADTEAAEAARKEEEIKAADEKVAAEKAAAEKVADDEKAASAEEDQGQEEQVKAPRVPATAPPVSMETMDDAQIKVVNDGLASAKARFQSGEIDYETYFDERMALERQLIKNDFATQLSIDGVETQWQWEQQSFLSAKDNDWINNDDVVYSAFAATVNRLMSTEEGETMPGAELLDLARSQVAARFSPTLDHDSATDEAAKAKNTALAGAKKTQAGKTIPDTLRGRPAAEVDGADGEFDYLDKLEGEAFEQAVERLSEQQLSRYEASA